MARYILKRLIYTIPTLIIVAVVAFMLIHLIPGGPATALLGLDATPERIADINRQLGLDRPLLEQFSHWFLNLLQGDFGKSLTFNKPVLDLIGQRLPITLQVTLVSLVVSLMIGIPAGIISAIKQGTYWDQIILFIAIIGVALPDFWLALNLVSFLSVDLRWFPTGGYVPMREGLAEWLHHIILPAFSLGFIFAAMVTRMTRSAMLDVLKQDYIKTARAKGQSEFVVLTKHALRNALIPILTVIGVSIAALMGGAVIIESVFSIPGLGRLIVGAIESRDYPVIQGVIVIFAVITIVVNFIVDILYKVVNPRIKLED